MMNIVTAITKRLEGFEIIRDYDIALYRLKCHINDVCPGISPSLDVSNFNPEPPVFACRFCTTPGYQQVLALADEDGKIALQDTKYIRRTKKALDGVQAHSNAIFDIAWMPEESKLVTASGDHSARLWEVDGSEIKQISCFQAHTQSLKTVVFRYEDKAVFATGARDGAIMIWDTRASHNDQSKADNCIFSAHSIGPQGSAKRRKGLISGSCENSITGLVFQDDLSLLSCSARDGLIKVWDLRKNYTTHKKEPLARHVMNGGNVKNGFTSLLICPARIKLYASCVDNTIYAFNISSYNPKPIAEFYGHENSSFYVKTCLSPDGRYIASGSSDGLAYIWHTDRPGDPLAKLCAHSKEVTCVAWCNMGGTKIVTCSDDPSHRIWRVGLEHKSDDLGLNVEDHAKVIFGQHLLNELKQQRTPTVSRRRCRSQEQTTGCDITPGSDVPNSGEKASSKCQSCNEYGNTNSSKRSFAQMIGEGSIGKSILSPIQENLESPSKRSHIHNRGPRRLFSPGNDGDARHNRSYSSDEPGPSSSTTASELDRRGFSLTLNLPNFVIDGTAPHLLEISPRKCKENMDWLTKISKEKQRLSKTPVAKSSSSPKAQTPVAARRTSRSKSAELRKTPKSPSVASLLNFVQVTGRDCSNEEMCSARDRVVPLQATAQTQQ